MSEYYIICKRHMFKRDFAVLFWGPNSSGYRYAIEDAGLYDDNYIRRFDGHHDDDLPVKKEIVDQLVKRYVIDRSSIGNIVENNKKNRAILAIKLSELLTGETLWDSRAFLTPQSYLAMNSKTEDLLKQIRQEVKL